MTAPAAAVYATDKSYLIDAVVQHYALIDAGNTAAVAELYSDDAEYIRLGSGTYRQRSGVLRFYTTVRAIRDGRHVLSEIVASGSTVAVRGSFNGHALNGDQVTIRFADFFVFEDTRRISRRETFIFAPIG